MGHSTVSCAKTAEPIEMPFWMKTRVAPRNHVLHRGVDPPRGRSNFRGLSGQFKSIGNLRCSGRCSFAAAFAAKGIIQYARQAQILFWKFLCAGDAAYRPRRGRWDCTAQAKSDIYDCLVLHSVWEVVKNVNIVNDNLLSFYLAWIFVLNQISCILLFEEFLS